MKGLGWFLLGCFGAVFFASLLGLSVSWSHGVVAIVFLLVGAALLLGSDRKVDLITKKLKEIRDAEMWLEKARRMSEGQKADGDGR